MKQRILNLAANDSRVYLCIILIFWIISVASRLLYNGLIFDLDFGIYQPDGIYYALRSLTWLGQNPFDAANQLVDWYRSNSAKNLDLPVSAIYPWNAEVWGLVGPRILYPLLSIPFVMVLGIPGMLVIPSLSLLLLMVSTYHLGRKYNFPFIGLILALGLSISPTILRWMISNTTDSLLLGLFSLVPILLVNSKKNSRNQLFVLLLVVLTNLTRFSFPIWIGIAFILFIYGARRISVGIFLLNIVSSIPTFLLQPKTAFLPLEYELSAIEKVFQLPKSFLKVGFYEIAQLAVLDRMLLLFLALALFGALTNLRSIESSLFLVVLVAVWALGAINGNVGVNFRYQLPLISFSIIPCIHGICKLAKWYSRNSLDIVRDKT
jgi:hypothetical protein